MYPAASRTSRVYVISPEAEWPCKIGVSAEPERRLKDLQAAHWNKLVLVRSMRFEFAYQVESGIKQVLGKKLLLGEWFDVRSWEAERILFFVAKMNPMHRSDSSGITWQLRDSPLITQIGCINR